MVGSGSFDDVSGLAVDPSGGIVVVGWSWGTWPDQPDARLFNGLVRRLDPSGSEVWRYVVGTPGNDRVHGVAMDDDGSIYVVGDAGGPLKGQPYEGGADYFVIKLDANGDEVWVTQIGTDGTDRAEAVSVDSTGNVVMAGSTVPRGSDRWHGLIVMLDGSDGSEIWQAEIAATGPTFLHAIDVDGEGNIYAGGWASGELPGTTPIGGRDALVVKYSAKGERLWVQRFGTDATDAVKDLAVGSGSNLYVLGDTSGTLPGQTARGGPDDPLKGPDDLFVARLSGMGSLQWAVQFGSRRSDSAGAIVLGGNGSVTVASTSQSFSDDYSLSAFIATEQEPDIWLLTADGSVRGSRRVPFEQPNNTGDAIGLSPDGAMILAGSTCLKPPCALTVESLNGRVDMFVLSMDIE